MKSRNKRIRLILRSDYLWPSAVFLIVSIGFWHQVIFLPKMLWAGDITRQYYPWFLELHRHLRVFSLPFWVPNMGAGYPLLAQGEAGVFYPVNWILIFLFSPSLGFRLYFPIHSFIAGFSLYLFCRSLKIGTTPSLFAGLVFSYSFFMTVRSIHPTIIAASSYAPLGLLAIESALTKKKLYKLFWLSIIVALQLFIGHPQITYISIMFFLAYSLLSLYFLHRDTLKHSLKLLAFVGITILLGIGLAGLQVFPTVELFANSERIQQGNEFLFAYSLPRSQFLTYIFPYFFGISPAYTNLGFSQFGGHYWEFALYIGILPFIFAVLGIVHFREYKVVKVLITLLIFFALMAVGGYLAPYRFAVRFFHLPFRVSARFLLPVTISLSILAGFGLKLLLENKDRIKQTVWVLMAFAGIILFILCITVLQSLGADVIVVSSLFETFAKKIIFTEFQNASLFQFSLFSDHIRSSAMMLTSCLILILFFKKHLLHRKIFFMLIFTLLISDLLFKGHQYQQPIDEKEIFKPPALINTLPSSPREYRMMTLMEPGPPDFEKNTLQPNLNLLWNIPSWNAITPLQLRLQNAYYKKALKNDTIRSLLNVRYLVSPRAFEQEGLKRILATPEYLLYENPQVYPRAFVVNNEEKAKLEKTKINTTSVQIEYYGDTDVALKVTAPNDGVLVLLDNFYPGWRASIDGQEVSLELFMDKFRQVPITRGSHIVRFWFVPIAFYQGMVLSIGSAIVLFWLRRYFRNNERRFLQP